MKRYGLIGYPLSHSFSEKYFSEKFRESKITDCQYQLFPLEKIEHIIDLYIQPDILGLNVTIPYKESVLDYIEYWSEDVKKIGACNCIKISNNETYAYNTDVIGFEKSLLPLLKSHHQYALILGDGGASKAVQFVLEKLGIRYKIVSRKPAKDSQTINYFNCTEDIVSSHTLIVNTTPLGMFPHIEEFPDISYSAITKKHLFYDLIYNPETTLFLEKGQEQGAVIKNGYEMLLIQAQESWRIWNREPVE